MLQSTGNFETYIFSLAFLTFPWFCLFDPKFPMQAVWALYLRDSIGNLSREIQMVIKICRGARQDLHGVGVKWLFGGTTDHTYSKEQESRLDDLQITRNCWETTINYKLQEMLQTTNGYKSLQNATKNCHHVLQTEYKRYEIATKCYKLLQTARNCEILEID
jgi:hypothetical protein